MLLFMENLTKDNKNNIIQIYLLIFVYTAYFQYAEYVYYKFRINTIKKKKIIRQLII